jgi:hypothetical protein
MRELYKRLARPHAGTKYVVESRGAHVHRYVEFPDGLRLRLTRRKAVPCTCKELSAASLVPTDDIEIAAAKPIQPALKPRRLLARQSAAQSALA